MFVHEIDDRPRFTLPPACYLIAFPKLVVTVEVADQDGVRSLPRAASKALDGRV
ncbi:hypothetical protein BFJ66_g17544 [Fusarium oxysporum f. sp. cepae]|uniref:Uncharacterized protein n=1 Tax=Fusarium oxysporum f. sp. cepae TaxID=396571 RepID=A0A3L6N346_FUSOX|nr:hypothetical protein BFJ65_g14968 [Fusarium oxysporum f. sp. cepae]RKK21507.1 hypothetical protein BFJ66_g17544 [Fusarium oxysporum f. sp. cepae]